MDPGTAYMLNASLLHGIPMDQIHLWITAGASLLFALLFIFVPLKFSKVGREEGATALPLLAYFSCLGAGFITLELVFIQKFMQLIGSPLYTYSTVIFTMLLGAGIGSAASERLGIDSRRRWATALRGHHCRSDLPWCWFIRRWPSRDWPCRSAGRIAVAARNDFPAGLLPRNALPTGYSGHRASTPRGHRLGVGNEWTVHGDWRPGQRVRPGCSGDSTSPSSSHWCCTACALAVFRKMRDSAPQAASDSSEPKEQMITTRSYDGPWRPGAAAK